mmetsp:Transcript_7605/g.19661  ORF Transcript_7605/g.19661 Transcript_7605/m.19661 type:complete len:147 (-) Transcript_7605:99-539(-)
MITHMYVYIYIVDKHKFLVQAMACGADTEVTRELFDGKESKVMDTRLTVAYVTPNPPSPVREEPDAGRSEAREGASERSEPGGGGGASVSQLRAENAKLRGNVSQLEAKTKLLDKDGPARVAFAGGFTLVHVLVIAILAFLLGRFT